MKDASTELMSLFCAVIERSPEDRAAFVEHACGQDAELRGRIEELLRAHDQAGGFLPETPENAVATDPERPDTVIGTYKLLEQIGEGGMGTVWMAQQTEPVKRLVALKVIKAGMDSKQVVARFEAERQALALMDHVNIARVLDGGTTGAGRPFFVMDLVKGVPITRFCDEQRLTPRQRLELFIPVCQAVQHAHQKGIIHRDLKPSNVLVALYDGKPVPKVIDFGVAKAAGQPLTEITLVTGFGAIVGTLEYMSPEQAELNQLDIDTRSDIYSLGVLLYELLTGTTPLEHKRVKESGFLEALRLIREEEVPTLSDRLSTTEELASIAAKRGMEPSKLKKIVHGELNWIVTKALEKDRSRRFETANAFALDVQRYLNDEPVQACPPSAGYRLRKWARRHRTLVTVSVGSIAGVLLALAAVTWQWQVAVQALADKESARKEEQAQRELAEANWAASLIALADRDWVLCDLNKARKALDQCPVKYRNDEWRRLHMVSHAEIASVPNEIPTVGFLVPQFSPDGKGVVTVRREKIVWHAGDDYRPTVLCDTPTNAFATRPEVGSNGADLTVTLFHFRIVNGKLGPPAFGIFDPRANRWLSQWTPPRIGSPRLNPGGNLLALHDHKGMVVIRDASTGNVLHTHAITITGFGALTAKRFAGCTNNKRSDVAVWDVASGALVQKIAVDPGSVSEIALSSDGEYVSYLTYRQSVLVAATVYSVRDGLLVGKLEAAGISCQAYSPDSRIFAIGLADGTLHLWDFARSGRSILLRGHTPAKRVTGIGFSPDGLRMASAGDDKLLKVWDLRKIREHFDAVAGDGAVAPKAADGE